MRGTLKHVAKSVCPPAFWNVVRRLRARETAPLAPPAPQPEPPAPPRQTRIIESLEALDREFARAIAAEAISTEAVNQILDAIEYAPPEVSTTNPLSAEYRYTQMAFYRHLTGRTNYSAEECEHLALTDDARARPFPYYTRSSTIIGEQLMAIGFLIRALDLPPGGSVLEFGPGFGRLTIELARADFRVTAVDINPEHVAQLRLQARRLNCELEAVQGSMLSFEPNKRFDRVIFYESFHHCEHHQEMIARLDSLVAPGGAAIFAGEPISDSFPMPWGVRRDGRSLWAIRRYGWLELGFRTDYFRELLRAHGWATQLHTSVDVPWQQVFIARRDR